MAKKATATSSADRRLQSAVNRVLKAAFEPLGGIEGLAATLRELKAAVSRRGTGKGAKRAGKGYKRPGRPSIHETCKVAGCGLPHYALALCSKHYQQHRRGQLKAARVKAVKQTRRARRPAARK